MAYAMASLGLRTINALCQNLKNYPAWSIHAISAASCAAQAGLPLAKEERSMCSGRNFSSPLKRNCSISTRSAGRLNQLLTLLIQ